MSIQDKINTIQKEKTELKSIIDEMTKAINKSVEQLKLKVEEYNQKTAIENALNELLNEKPDIQRKISKRKTGKRN